MQQSSSSWSYNVTGPAAPEAHVASASPPSGEPVRLVAGPRGVYDVEPATAVQRQCIDGGLGALEAIVTRGSLAGIGGRVREGGELKSFYTRVGVS